MPTWSQNTNCTLRVPFVAKSWTTGLTTISPPGADVIGPAATTLSGMSFVRQLTTELILGRSVTNQGYSSPRITEMAAASRTLTRLSPARTPATRRMSDSPWIPKATKKPGISPPPTPFTRNLLRKIPRALQESSLQRSPAKTRSSTLLPCVLKLASLFPPRFWKLQEMVGRILFGRRLPGSPMKTRFCTCQKVRH